MLKVRPRVRPVLPPCPYKRRRGRARSRDDLTSGGSATSTKVVQGAFDERPGGILSPRPFLTDPKSCPNSRLPEILSLCRRYSGDTCNPSTRGFISFEVARSFTSATSKLLAAAFSSTTCASRSTAPGVGGTIQTSSTSCSTASTSSSWISTDSPKLTRYWIPPASWPASPRCHTSFRSHATALRQPRRSSQRNTSSTYQSRGASGFHSITPTPSSSRPAVVYGTSTRAGPSS